MISALVQTLHSSTRFNMIFSATFSFIALIGFSSSLAHADPATSAPRELSLCIIKSPGKRCFTLETSHWIQDLGAGLRAQTPIDKKEISRLETEISNFKAWTKSELAKRPPRKGDCQFTAEFSLNSKTETLCYDSIQGKKLDTKIEAVVKSLSSVSRAL